MPLTRVKAMFNAASSVTGSWARCCFRQYSMSVLCTFAFTFLKGSPTNFNAASGIIVAVWVSTRRKPSTACFYLDNQTLRPTPSY